MGTTKSSLSRMPEQPVEDCKASHNIIHDPPPRFAYDDPDAYNYLDEHGYVVIKDVANAEELARAEDLLWEYLELHGMKRTDPRTWDDENFPGSIANGIICKRGFGQSPFLWHLRTLPKVISVFQRIWKTDDVVTSFDGGNVFRPWQYNPDWITLGGWWHVDQGPTKRGRHAVQGLVTLYDADEGTGGLCVIPKSHQHHAALLKNLKGDGDFHPIPETEPLLNTESQLVAAKGGDLLLWDSRVVHCNTPGIKGKAAKAKAKDRLLRAVGYVCMIPKKMVPSDVTNERIKAFEQQQTCTHWPQHCRTTCAPVKAGNEINPESVPSVIKRLVGYEG
eukprot:Sspe_Gene.27335::Locus_11716_Transcript_2_2_Confidence_0.667_Length_1138::g.27335::m.27335